jgi:hypothetical protein
MNKIAIDGVQYKEEFFMIADGKVSITVYRAGEKITHVIIYDIRTTQFRTN